MSYKPKVLLSASIANSFEWYNYALFGQLASIIGSHFFPSQDPTIALMQGFLLFAIGYVIRPVGGIVFGIIGDKFGRKFALIAAILCMAFPTCIIGLLPTYQQIGIWSPILLIVVRMLQGLSMGGALTGSVSFLIEHTHPSRRGVIGSFTMSSICWGILLSSLVIFLVKQCTTSEEFYSWGWRVPFLIGFLIVFAGFYIHKHTDETPNFEKMQEKNKLVSSPLKKVFSNYTKDIIVSIFINSTGSVVFYMQAIYIMNYLKINRDMAEGTVDIMMNLSYIVTSFIIIFAGWVSDKIGRKKLYFINLIMIIICFYHLMLLFENGNELQVFGGLMLISILSAFYIGPEPALQTEFYPSNIRNTALSVAYNIATSLFGGTTPYILGYLVLKTGTIKSTVIYIIICAIISIIALLFYKDRSKHDKWDNI